jgi:hypothetical protein
MTSAAIGPAPRRRVALFGVAVPAFVSVAVTMLRCCVVEPWALGYPAWVFSADAFVSLPAAKYVAHGAVFQMYEPAASRVSSIGYPYTPGLPIVLAPFGWIADRFALLDNLRFAVARPNAFLVVGPVVVLLGTVPLLAAVGKALRALPPTRVVATQWAVLAVTAAVSLYYMHPEDAIACACLVAAVTGAASGRTRYTGAMLAIAILFKQWAVIPAIVVLAAVPPSRRLVTAFYALAVPALTMIPFLVLSPHATVRALTGAEATLRIGQQQLWTTWLFGDEGHVSATGLRVMWLAVALVAASRVRSRPALLPLLGAVGIVMLARLLFEPTVFAYYLGPPFAFALLCAAMMHRPLLLRTTAAVAMQCWCAFHGLPPAGWWLVLASGTAYVCAPLLDALAASAPGSDDARPARPVAVPSLP